MAVIARSRPKGLVLVNNLSKRGDEKYFSLNFLYCYIYFLIIAVLYFWLEIQMLHFHIEISFFLTCMPSCTYICKRSQRHGKKRADAVILPLTSYLRHLQTSAHYIAHCQHLNAQVNGPPSLFLSSIGQSKNCEYNNSATTKLMCY